MRRTVVIIAGLLFLGFFLIPTSIPVIAGGKGLVSLLYLPFLACVVLVGIHTYFGIHVISREIIFVDLSLAQVAALGTVMAFSLGVALHTPEAYAYSLAFALAGAVVFAVSRTREGRVPQEAIIGIVYAVTSASAMLLVDRNPEGMEVIKSALTGDILWVDSRSIISTSRIYAFVAVFLVAFHGRFLLISHDPRGAMDRGMRIKLWDMAFYTSFGVVITKSVEISGILLVFSFLVVPAVISSLFFTGLGRRLATGWILGTIASVLGLFCSYGWDLSAGPTIVGFLTLALILSGIVKYISGSGRKVIALGRVMTGTACLAALLVGFYLASPAYRGTTDMHGHDADVEEEIHGGVESVETGHPPGTRALHFMDHLELEPENEKLKEALSNEIDGLIALLDDESTETRERAAVVIGEIGRGSLVLRALERALSREEDAWVRYEIAKSAYRIDRKKGEGLLRAITEGEGTPEFLKSEALLLLEEGKRQKNPGAGSRLRDRQGE